MPIKVLVEYTDRNYYRDEIELTKEEIEDARAAALIDFISPFYNGKQTFEEFFNTRFSYYLDLNFKSKDKNLSKVKIVTKVLNLRFEILI